MIKINNRVSLFNNMGKTGTVVGFQKRENNLLKSDFFGLVQKALSPLSTIQ